jgi:F-type H+-transporting ATPase subunit O
MGILRIKPLYKQSQNGWNFEIQQGTNIFLSTMLQSSLRSGVLSQGLGRRTASGIALKYSNATYAAALARSPQVLNRVQAELNTISASIKDTPELNAFVHNPTLSAKDRTAGLATIYTRLEESGAKKEVVSDVTKNLFAILSENGRLGEIHGVIEGFNELFAKYKGELTVVITSAAPLPRDIQNKLESTLKQSQAAKQSKTLKVTNKVSSGAMFAPLRSPDVMYRRSTLLY